MKRTTLLTSVFLGAALIVPAAASAKPNNRYDNGTFNHQIVNAEYRQAQRALDALERRLNRLCGRGCVVARRNIVTVRASLNDIHQEVRKVDVRPVHARPATPPKPKPTRYTYPKIRQKMKNARSDVERRSILTYASHLELTMNQACALLVTFRSPDQRLEALKTLQPLIVDPHNVRVLDEAFARRSDRRSARQIIWNAAAKTEAVAYNRGRGSRAR